MTVESTSTSRSQCRRLNGAAKATTRSTTTLTTSSRRSRIVKEIGNKRSESREVLKDRGSRIAIREWITVGSMAEATEITDDSHRDEEINLPREDRDRGTGIEDQEIRVLGGKGSRVPEDQESRVPEDQGTSLLAETFLPTDIVINHQDVHGIILHRGDTAMFLQEDDKMIHQSVELLRPCVELIHQNVENRRVTVVKFLKRIDLEAHPEIHQKKENRVTSTRRSLHRKPKSVTEAPAAVQVRAHRPTIDTKSEDKPESCSCCFQFQMILLKDFSIKTS